MIRLRMSCYAACAALALAAFAAMSGSLLAQGIDTNNPDLPPDGVYLTPEDVHTTYSGPGLEIILERPEHKPIAQEVQRRESGPDEIETFASSLVGTAVVTIPSEGINGVHVPFDAFGAVQTLVKGKVGNTTGTFDTEMLSMDLTGNSALGPFMIRESPTIVSPGQTTITDIGGGMYHIDSFFDVFTEISIDGGANWIPSTGPARVVLIPEPSSIMLLGLGVIGIAGCLRHRQR